MVKLFVQALCLMSAAGTALAMPYADDAHAYSVQDSSTDWPFSELIHESPFEFPRRRQEETMAMAGAGARGASRTLPPLRR